MDFVKGWRQPFFFSGKGFCKKKAVLKRLFDKYLRDNAAIFNDRLALIEKRGMDNDQLYIEEELLTEIQGR